ncbi:ATP-binding protein [Shewanella sp. UCD-KL12]|uniref:ATP-binding protein n=1 Tax=Shewanella sp. UCD-KL12 TaxID=1917163 RepID=UPI0009708752|nr:ATP-binding protein [Shewanella sp. UCD-KL12]
MPARSLFRWLSFSSIGSKVIVSMISISLLVLLLSASNYLMNTRVKEDTTSVSTHEIPKAIAAINMLDEIGDMNANVLEYVLGEVDERNDFDRNQEEFALYLSNLRQALTTNDRRIDEVEELFNDFHTTARAQVFNRYNPDNEDWARQRVKGLTDITGRKLEILLDSLKESEIQDVGSQPNIDEVIHDDLPGVRYYLELVDEAGDMVADLSDYVAGNYEAKISFIQNAQNFEEFLTKLKPLEMKPTEVAQLQEVEALYKVLRDGGFEVFQRYNSSNKTLAIKAIDDLEHQTFARLERLLDEVSIDAGENANVELLGLREVTVSNQYILITSLVLVLMLCASIIYFSYRSITEPITKLSGTMKQLADGDTEVQVVYLERNDEVGYMAKAIEIFKNNMIERNRVEQELVTAKDNAEEASRAKASFLATMSHEIRTPMNGIIGMIDLLLTSSMNRDQRNMTNTIRESAFSLLNIINDILDFSKIEAGKLELENIHFSISELLESVVDTITPNADEKGVSLELYTDPQIPHQLHGDPIRIRQILFNLLGNAVKFSSDQQQAGKVRISLTSQEISDKLVSFSIEIEDNGIGIKPESLEGLFKPFTQAESSTTRRFGGTGLGLAICYNIISLMKGDIKVKSESGQGSSFTISLSLPYSDIPKPKEDYKDTLVINDIQSDWLSECVNGYFNAHNINIITLPYVSINSFLSDNYQHSIHTVVVTDNIAHCEAQLTQYISKELKDKIKFLVLNNASRGEGVFNDHSFSIAASPLKLTTLLYGFNVVLGRESPLENLTHDGEEILKSHLPLKEAEEAGRLILVAEDNQTNQEVIKRQLNKLGYSCIIADDGIDALELYPKYNFVMVLTDCHMPRMDGYELAGLLKKQQKKSAVKLPIIAITANALVGEADKCIAAGMDDYLSKPVELAKLNLMLKKWLTVPKKAIGTQEETASQPVVSLLDKQAITTIFADDMQDYADSLADFLELSLPQVKAMVKDKSFNVSTIGELAHKLKSSAKMLGVTCIGEPCEAIEQTAKQGDTPANKVTIQAQLDAMAKILPQIEDEITSVIHSQAHS